MYTNNYDITYQKYVWYWKNRKLYDHSMNYALIAVLIGNMPITSRNTETFQFGMVKPKLFLWKQVPTLQYRLAYRNKDSNYSYLPGLKHDICNYDVISCMHLFIALGYLSSMCFVTCCSKPEMIYVYYEIWVEMLYFDYIEYFVSELDTLHVFR